MTSFSYLTETPGVVDTLLRKVNQGVEVHILGLAPNTPSAKAAECIFRDLQELERGDSTFHRKDQASVLRCSEVKQS